MNTYKHLGLEDAVEEMSRMQDAENARKEQEKLNGRSSDDRQAAVQAKCSFASYAGCELHSLRYAGDECNTEEILAWMNQLDEGKDYVQVAEFISDFHSPVQPDEDTAWEPDTEYTEWEWRLARTADGGWQLLAWGYR